MWITGEMLSISGSEQNINEIIEKIVCILLQLINTLKKTSKTHVFQFKFSHFKILKLSNALILLKTTRFNASKKRVSFIEDYCWLATLDTPLVNSDLRFFVHLSIFWWRIQYILYKCAAKYSLDNHVFLSRSVSNGNLPSHFRIFMGSWNIIFVS